MAGVGSTLQAITFYIWLFISRQFYLLMMSNNTDIESQRMILMFTFGDKDCQTFREQTLSMNSLIQSIESGPRYINEKCQVETTWLKTMLCRSLGHLPHKVHQVQSFLYGTRASQLFWTLPPLWEMAVGLAITNANLQFSLFIRENNLRQCFQEYETKALTNLRVILTVVLI